jgi:hypothetical protein
MVEQIFPGSREVCSEGKEKGNKELQKKNKYEIKKKVANTISSLSQTCIARTITQIYKNKQYGAD